MTRSLAVLAFVSLATAAASTAASAETCAKPQDALGVSRIVEIDTKSGPLFGEYSKYQTEPRFLGPKEVVLTFDDGPLPRYTKPILDALDQYCTKATFFYVGEMAMAYPDTVKEVMGRGHTMGTHTWSHPFNLPHVKLDRAKDQIERGFAAVALAAGKPIAPFFRFPGLSDSGPMLAYLQERGVASFTVDIISNDSYIGSSQHLAKRTLDLIEKKDGGIVLFHDIKPSTAKALPTILSELKKRGYKIVHLRAKADFAPLPALTTELEERRAKAEAKEGSKPKPEAEFTAIAASTLEGNGEPPVTELAPEAHERTHAGGTHATASTPVTSDAEPVAEKPVRRRHRHGRRSKVSATNDQFPSLGSVISGRY